jgi:putative heme-binding domain-containing protein
MKRPGAVRDHNERFLPDDQRVRRLGAVIDSRALLAMKGDATRGKEVFFRTSGPRCAACHKVGDAGSTLGPELTQIAKKLDRAKLLETLLDPSKEIEDKYRAYALETTAGQLHTGLLVSRSEKEVVLRDAQDKEVRIPAGKVAALVPQKQSLMPDQLLRDLTAQEAADLLAYLEGLR